MTTQVNGTSGITFSDSSVQNTAGINFRNRIINGAMMIDQRNAGASVTITNTSANSLLVYPASGGYINSLAQNAGFTQGTSATLQFIAPTATQWYTVGATYA